MYKKTSFVMFFLILIIGLNSRVFAELPDQIMIEVKIVEILDTTGSDLGVEWTSKEISKNTNVRQLQTALDFLDPIFDRGVDLQLNRWRYGSTVLNARLQLLLSEGKAELLANPRIVTINGKTAKFVAGDQIPYQTTKLAGTKIVYATEFKDAGVILSVVPTIQEENFILLSIETEVTSLSGSQDVIFGGDGTQPIFTASLPIFATRKMQTNLLVKDGGTLVMGGLYRNDTSEQIEKTPFLGSIPFLGVLFRHTKKQSRKLEMVTFITPHIIRPGEGESNIDSESLKNALLKKSSLKEKIKIPKTKSK